ncbi:MAG: pyruvate dehydrogenase (acetyl-transferring), homodimeric type [Planctomycetota bacterium]|nr:MAG: pyruvate dehydrogenase (acetyl-transferring), homodimeric type [Planctomycetota bacterium]
MSENQAAIDVDPQETLEWVDSLEDLLVRWGPERVRFLLGTLEERARLRGVSLPFRPTTPQTNTIPPADEPDYPGDEALEERIEALVRWNAVAMVVKANTNTPGLGGHLATFASSATLYEVAFHHIFRAKTPERSGDQVYFQGHGSPGMYARAFLEGRLSERHLDNFRRELAPGGGLSSYPHPWLMPDFWEFPTVSMGLGPISAIYQARFNRYLHDRGLLDTSSSHVWGFLGDGEMDEPESRGALHIAARDGLDNLSFVVNCNLQRLDGPVRGNGSIIQELEGSFRGAGWNVIKVLWSREWDELFAADEDGHLAAALAATPDGELQRLSALGPDALRRDFFGRSPALARLVEGWSDERLAGLRRGGFDRRKIYAAYRAALAHRGQPTVILAHTVKGWGMGKGGQAANSTHQQKKLKTENLLGLRDRFGVPLSDAEVEALAFAHPGPNSPEVRYLQERRAALGGPFPARSETAPPIEAPPLEFFAEFLSGSEREASTTMAFVRLLSALMRHENLGRWVVPIVPDEARTFGMEAFFRQFGIYSPHGQRYDPVDKGSLLYYREARDGQVVEEGITEAGALCTFTAAGTSHASHGVNAIPFFIFYSMFGFQRVGDLVWAAGDARCRGFLCGATAGRTTLNGEGLQHEDGHSHILAAPHPTVRCYDPAYAYETAVIVQDGLRRMYQDQEPCLYYLTLYNENYAMPAMPDGAAEGIVRGMYRLRSGGEGGTERATLFGSGTILPEVLRAADILAERYDVLCDVYSVTSYKQLRSEATLAEHHNRHHPEAPPRSCHLWDTLKDARGPFVAATDYVALVPDQIAPWVPGRLWSLGTDGFGRSDTRAALRRHFEVDAESVVVTTLYALAREGRCDPKLVGVAQRDLGLDPEKQHSLFA